MKFGTVCILPVAITKQISGIQNPRLRQGHVILPHTPFFRLSTTNAKLI